MDGCFRLVFKSLMKKPIEKQSLNEQCNELKTRDWPKRHMLVCYRLVYIMINNSGTSWLNQEQSIAS